MNKLEKLRELWGQLPGYLKVFGYVVFVWAAWRTVPIISIIMQLAVLAVGLLFIIACLGASEETVRILNSFRIQVMDYMNNPEPESQPEQESES